MNEKEWFFSKTKYSVFLVVAMLLVCLIWWYWWDILWKGFWWEDHANLRWDAYGALNTLFSWLAFAGIIISILMQSEELKLQRKELKATRDEFKIQSEVFKKDNFEKWFYNLLELLGSSLDGFLIEPAPHWNELKWKEWLRVFLKKWFLISPSSGNCRIWIWENIVTNEILDQYLRLPVVWSNTIMVYIQTFNLLITSIFQKIHNKTEIPYYIAILKSRMIDVELDLINLKLNSITNNDLKEYYKNFLEYKWANSI